jgi:zinc/manganese transport system substrate-binding protein
MSRPVRLAAIAAAVIAAAATAVACARSEQAGGQPASGTPIAVVASTNVWASVARAVGGSDVTVKAIVDDPAGDPHSYQVNARDAAALRGADLVVYNGGGYDDFVEQALGATGGPRRIKAVDLLEQPSGSGASSQPPTTHGFGGSAAAGAHETLNEHVWYDLPTVAMTAGEIASQLSELRPAAKASFIANADAFDRRLDTLQGKVGDVGATFGGRQVVATEPVAHYLLDAARLVDVTPHDFVDAVEEETDPPAAAVAKIQKLVTEGRVAVLVHNPQTETPVVADLVGKAHAAALPVVDMTETLPTGQDYPTWMGNQIQALSDALGHR